MQVLGFIVSFILQLLVRFPPAQRIKFKPHTVASGHMQRQHQSILQQSKSIFLTKQEPSPSAKHESMCSKNKNPNQQSFCSETIWRLNNCSQNISFTAWMHQSNKDIST